MIVRASGYGLLFSMCHTIYDHLGHKVNGAKMEIAGIRRSRIIASMPRKIPQTGKSDLDAVEVGRRLRAMREALGLKPSEIADQIGMERTYWSRFEGGKRPLTLDMAYKICKSYPVTMDYLFLGRIHTLSDDIASKIRPLLNA